MTFEDEDFPVKTNPPSSFLTVKLVRRRREWQRKVVACLGEIRVVEKSTGLPLNTWYWPDRDHATNQIYAAIHRFGCHMPDGVVDVKRDFSNFFKGLVVSIPFVREDDVVELDEWLRSSSYAGGRKQYLLNLAKKMSVLTLEMANTKGQIKGECYPEPKHARGINSHSDESKLLFAPLMKAIEKKTYSHFSRFFVKGTQPREWPSRLRDLFGTRLVSGTDFSSFEAHHYGIMNECIKFWIMHCIRELGETSHFRRLVARLLDGSNVCEFSRIKVVLSQRLMSGAMWTSSANGMLNFTLMAYMTLRKRYPLLPIPALVEKIVEFDGVFEGDDGLCITEIEQNDIDDLGLKLKMEPKTTWNLAKFCQIVCDEETGQVLTDPIRVLNTINALPSKYYAMKPKRRAALMRAKAMSLAYNYSNVPIVGQLCYKICEMTRGIDVRGLTAELGQWKNETLDLAIREKSWQKKPNVPESARLIVDAVYGVPVEVQYMLEEQIRQSGVKIELSMLEFISEWQIKYVTRYVGIHPPDPPPLSEHLIDHVESGIVKIGSLPKAVRQADGDFARKVSKHAPLLLSQGIHLA